MRLLFTKGGEIMSNIYCAITNCTNNDGIKCKLEEPRIVAGEEEAICLDEIGSQQTFIKLRDSYRQYLEDINRKIWE